MEIFEIKELLDYKHDQYNDSAFVENDPIRIPHEFNKKEDIEIAAFLTAIISWGQRKTIISNAKKMMELMDWAPYDFVLNHSQSDLLSLSSFVHRTFQGEDLVFFIQSLHNIYAHHGGLETVFATRHSPATSLFHGITHFRDIFFGIKHPVRTLKHISNIEKNSSAKRLMMFLRWMVRKDQKGVDFGLWTKIKPSELYLPLDVHTANASRKLGLLTLNANNWKSVLEITRHLRKFDPEDPIKYDFALFGLSAFDKI